jgi:cytochrome c oxidase assembly protein subunit 15
MDARMRARLSLSPRAYAAVAIAAQLILVIIVVSGAGVRTSGSGLGCPDWPDCRGTFIPALDYHTWMEYGNRLLSSLVGVVCVAAGLLVFLRRPFRRDLVAPALVLPVGVVAEGALGAGAVIFDLSWPVVIAHYLTSLGLLVAATVLVWRVRREPDAPPVAGDLVTVIATRTLVAFGAVVIVLGTFATAAGPHAGGAGTGDVVERLGALGPDTLRTLIHLHGHLAAVLGFVAIGVWLLARRRSAAAPLQRSLTAICLLLGAQGAIGLWQYYTNLPAGVVWLHASLPAALWGLLVWSWLAAGRPVAAPAGGARGPDRDAPRAEAVAA